MQVGVNRLWNSQLEVMANSTLKILVTLLSIVFYSNSASSQSDIYRDENVNIQFYSSTPLEDIQATSNSSRAILDASTGEIAVLVKIRDFGFKKRLMKKHFNEQYMESDKYPESTFSGMIKGINSDDLSDTNESYPVEGIINIHGINKELEVTAQLTKEDNILYGKAEFYVLLEDFNIKRPKLLIKNIADKILVSINMKLEKQ